MSVQTHLTNTASNLVLSALEKSSINTSISSLKSKLDAYFGSDIKEQVQFGSSTRGTILPRKADSKSDIDYMIIFDNEADYKPQTFINRLKRFAEAKYTSSQIAQSHPTVVLSLNHIKFDLVPAYKGGWFGNTIYIPAPADDYSEWLTTDPNGFNQKLTNANNCNSSLLKPMIRLVKYWNAQNNYVYDSYTLEQHLVDASYLFDSTIKSMFYRAINNLETWSLPQYKKDKVERAQKVVKETKSLEDDGYPGLAEAEIKKIIPIL